MTFIQAIETCFKKYADFKGRARRSEYWYWFLLEVIVSAVFTYLGSATNNSSIISSLQGLVSLAMLVPGLAVAWRRMHDIGKSGTYWFWNFLPLIGNIMFLVKAAQPGDPGENAYGPDPKEVTWEG